MINLIDNEIQIGENIEIITRKDWRTLTADVYQVPVEYRASGYFVGYRAFNESKEIPASRTFTFIGSVDVGPNEAALLERMKSDKVQQLNELYEDCTLLLESDYPRSERESWPIQAREAEALRKDLANPTPWIDAAAARRGLTREGMAALIEPMEAAYSSKHGDLSGARQELRDAIYRAEDQEALSDVDIIGAMQAAKADMLDF